MDTFIKPTLRGGRFHDHTVPVDVAADWIALEELIFQVAREMYLAEEDRIRVPKGFRESFYLKLVNVSPGSAIPEFAIPDSPYVDYFAKARDAVLASMLAAHLAASIPVGSVPLWDRFGRSLREGEAIVFSTPKDPEIVYDQDVRRRIILGHKATYEVAGTIKGAVYEADFKSGTFQIEHPINGKVGGIALDAVSRPIILERMREYPKGGGWVEVTGFLQVDRNHRILAVDEPRVESLSPLDIDYQIARIRTLEPGWLDGEGKVPSAADLTSLHVSLGDLPAAISQPGIFPTEDGEVQLEWRNDTTSVVVQTHFHEQKVEVRVVHINSTEEVDETLRFDRDGWSRVFAIVEGALAG